MWLGAHCSRVPGFCVPFFTQVGGVAVGLAASAKSWSVSLHPFLQGYARASDKAPNCNKYQESFPAV